MSAPLWDQFYRYIKIRAFGLAVFVLSQPRIVQLLCDYSVSAFADQSGFCLESLGLALDAAFSLAKRARTAGRGRALLSKDVDGEAVPDFSHAIVRNPKDTLARNGRAWALFKLGNL